MIYDKIKENIVTILIPLLTVIVTDILLTKYGKEQSTTIIFGIIGLTILIIIGYVITHFLGKSKTKWKENDNVHNELKEKITKLELSYEKIRGLIKTEEKINKLEKDISYLEGRIENKKMKKKGQMELAILNGLILALAVVGIFYMYNTMHINQNLPPTIECKWDCSNATWSPCIDSFMYRNISQCYVNNQKCWENNQPDYKKKC